MKFGGVCLNYEVWVALCQLLDAGASPAAGYDHLKDKWTGLRLLFCQLKGNWARTHRPCRDPIKGNGKVHFVHKGELLRYQKLK